jgi:hypothetical protein
VYEVSTLLGCWLLAEGAAEPTDDGHSATMELTPRQQIYLRVEKRRPSAPARRPEPMPLAHAADREPRRKKRRRR